MERPFECVRKGELFCFVVVCRVLLLMAHAGILICKRALVYVCVPCTRTL